MIKYIKTEKPLKNICPQKYCFNWVDESDQFDEGEYKHLVNGVLKEVKKVESGCDFDFGKCKRFYRNLGEDDFYEPDEVALDNDGLPWFFFIDNPNQLIDELKDVYIKESEKLWGKEHWKR